MAYAVSTHASGDLCGNDVDAPSGEPERNQTCWYDDFSRYDKSVFMLNLSDGWRAFVHCTITHRQVLIRSTVGRVILISKTIVLLYHAASSVPYKFLWKLLRRKSAIGCGCLTDVTLSLFSVYFKKPWNVSYIRWPLSASLPTQNPATQQFVVLRQCCKRQHNELLIVLWASV